MASESANRGRGPEWELYAEHRRKFTQAVLSLAPATPGRLCVLGAGKCNDLDLASLSQAFRELHLVDLDQAALASGVARETPELRKQLVLHAPVDLSVLGPKRKTKWQRRAPSASELEAAADATLQGLLARVPGPFDVVVSACILTQLGFALSQAFREPHPLLGPLRMSVVRTHLQTLLGLTAPNGSALFVSDLASSTHYPPLTQLPRDADLSKVLRDIVASRAFYQVARPDLLEDLLAELAEAPPAPISPWLWTGPQERTYLVYGYEIRRNSATA